MKYVMINENSIGLLFDKGVFKGVLAAGKHRLKKNREIDVLALNGTLHSAKAPLDILLLNEKLRAICTTVEVGDEELALHYVDGRFCEALRQGKYAFFRTAYQHTFTKVDISDPRVDESVPSHVFQKLSPTLYSKVEVSEHEKALLYIDKKLEGVLSAGTYYFWRTARKVETAFVDMRMRQMDVTGQEILTADKVTLRINFVLRYRITDCVKAVSEIESLYEQMHVSAQLALREFVGKYRLDELLESRDELSRFVYERLKQKENELFIEITDAGVKDIILPGEIREIMNTVLVAEKRAQANVITRREEVASTRSLLNTARLMDENETLYKLKELEFIERIAANVGNINLQSGGDILSQLVSMVRPKEVNH